MYYWVKYKNLLYAPREFVRKFRGTHVAFSEIEFVDPNELLDAGKRMLEKMLERNYDREVTDSFRERLTILEKKIRDAEI